MFAPKVQSGPSASRRPKPTVERKRGKALPAEELLHLQEATAAFSSALTAEDVVRAAVTSGRGVLGAAAGAAWLVDSSQECARQSWTEGVLSQALASCPVFSLREGRSTLLGRALSGGSALWVSSRVDWRKHNVSTEEKKGGFPGALAVIPLVVQERGVGVLAFTFAGERLFTEPERVLMEIVARHAAQAVERALLFDAEREGRARAEQAEATSRKSAARMARLAEASRELGEVNLELPLVLEAFAQQTVELVGDACIVFLVSEDGQHLDPAMVRCKPARYQADLLGVLQSHRLRADEGLNGLVATGRRPLLIPSFQSDPMAERIGANLGPFVRGLGSLAVVPLEAKGRVLGTVNSARKLGEPPHSAEEVDFLRTLSNRAASAIESARLYEQAQRAIGGRDEFLSIAGHELRTPLTALHLNMQSLLRLVKSETPDSQLVLWATRAAHNVRRLSALIDELLDLSRVNVGQLQLQREMVDLSVVASDVVYRLAEELARARCRTILDCAPNVVGEWDRLRVDQLVTNLVTNAMKYGRGKPIEIRVARDRDRTARLTVKDQGIGIAVEDQERIFQRFERAVSSLNFGGLGLGLWVARQVAEAHGGRVSVESRPGEGATFTMELPLAARD